MAAPHGQLSLSTPVEELKKSCICLHGSKRCTRKRYHAGNDVKYDTLLDDMTLNWDDLDKSEQATAAQRFADFSVCGTCMKESRHHDVQAEFLREKAAASAVSPSRQQRAASTSMTAISSRELSPTPHLRNSSPDASDMLDHSDADGDATNATVTSEAGSGRNAAGATYASSQTFVATPHARPASQGQSRPPPLLLAALSPAASRRGSVIPSSSAPEASSSDRDRASPTPYNEASSPTASSRSSSPAPNRDEDDRSTVSGGSETTILEWLPAVRANARAPTAQDNGGVQRWFKAHIYDIIIFNVGGMFWTLLTLATFVIWAANRA